MRVYFLSSDDIPVEAVNFELVPDSLENKEEALVWES